MNTKTEVMSKEEYVRRCAAEYMRLADVDEPFAIDSAEACYEAYMEDTGFSDGPEEDARTDMSYWDNDGEG